MANIILHGVLGAVNGSAQGGNALAGAAGAITAEGAAHLVMAQLYPGKTVADLTNEERMNLSAISTAIAGLAGGLVADSSMGVGTGASAGKNAVENNYLNSSDHQEKTELEHAQKQTQLTEEQEKQLIEFKVKDEATTDALIIACSDIGSDSCKAERKTAYDEMETYQNITYAHLKEHQAGYQEIKGLLQATSPEGDLMRQIYDGYKNGYIGLGYSQEEAGVMAGRTIGTQLILNGVSGTIGLDALNKLWSTSKVNGSAGKGTIQTGKEISTINANEIRLSQNTVSYNKTDRVTGQKYTYDDLVMSMKNDGWKGDPVDVVKMSDGRVTSMDNTRITAAREAGIDVKATVHGFNEKLTPEIQKARGWEQYKTWGEAIQGRINNQSGGFGKLNPNGSDQSPIIKGKK